MLSVADITSLIENKLAQMGLELCGAKFHRAGSRSVLRLYIDKEGGVTIGDCEAASIEISTVLDVENFSSTPYRLEVSSPGAQRPLRTEKDFGRIKGRRVRVDMRGESGKEQAVSGTVAGCRNGRLVLITDSGEYEIMLDAVIRAKIEFSFK